MTDDGELFRLKKLQETASLSKNLAWTHVLAVELRNQEQIAKLKNESDELSDEVRQLLRRSAYAFKIRDHVKARSYAAKVSRLKQRIAYLDGQMQHLLGENKRALNQFLLRRNELAAIVATYTHAWVQRDAGRAGIPTQYLDDLWITTHSDGSTGVYCGGDGNAAGPGHGHYVVDKSGEPIYQRAPFSPHGSHNFVRHMQPEVQSARMTPQLAQE